LGSQAAVADELAILTQREHPQAKAVIA
jgi:hypothetical protein